MEADRVWKAPCSVHPPRTFPHPLEIPIPHPLPGIPTAPKASAAMDRIEHISMK